MARARKNLLKIYTGLNDRPLHEQEESDIETYNSPSGELHKVDHSKKEEKVEVKDEITKTKENKETIETKEVAKEQKQED